MTDSIIIKEVNIQVVTTEPAPSNIVVQPAQSVSTILSTGIPGLNGTSSITFFNTFEEIPVPYTGVARVGHSLYTGNGDTALEIPSLNSAGELVANIVPRTGTLAELKNSIGSAGELASATDQAAIIKFNGTTVGGDVFYSVPRTTSKSTVYENAINIPSYTLNNVSGYYPYSSVVGATNAQVGDNIIRFVGDDTSTAVVVVSCDGINWGTIAAPSTALNSGLLNDTNGMVLVPRTSGITCYYWNTVTFAWVAYATTVTSGAYSPPLWIDNTYGSIAITGNSSKYVLLGDSTLTEYSFSDTRYGVRKLSPKNNSIFAVKNTPESLAYTTYFDPDGLKIKELRVIDKNGDIATIYDFATPIPCTAQAIIQFTANHTLVGSTTSDIVYIDGVRITLPEVTDVDTLLVTSDNDYFYLAYIFSGVTYVYSTVDGSSWTKFAYPTPSAAVTSIQICNSGLMLFSSGHPVMLAVNENTFVYGSKVASFSVGKSAIFRNAVISLPPLTAPKNAYADSVIIPRMLASVSNVPVTGATYNTPLNVAKISIRPATPLADLTIKLPYAPFDGQVITYMFTQAVTTLTFNPATSSLSGTLINGLSSPYFVTSAAAHTTKVFIYDASGKSWMLVQ